MKTYKYFLRKTKKILNFLMFWKCKHDFSSCHIYVISNITRYYFCNKCWKGFKGKENERF